MEQRILVVDDDHVLRRALVRILERAGYDVTEAATGQEALQRAEETQPPLVLLDVMLPDIGGFEVCRRLKTDPVFADPYVLLISGPQSASDVQAEGLEAGADDYVGRGIGQRELIARVEAGWQMKEATEALRETRERLQGMILASPNPIMLLDVEGIVELWNPAAESLFGWTAAEVIGRPLPIVRPQDRDEFRELRIRVAQGEALRDIEIHRQRKDGSIVPLSLSTAPVRDATGTVVGIMAILQDITAHVNQIQEIECLNSVLRAISNINQLLVREKDPQTLIGRACEALVQTDVYDNAMIAVLRSDDSSEYAVEAGSDGHFSDLVLELRDGATPACVRQVLERAGVVADAGPQSHRDPCPLHSRDEDRVVMTAPLIHRETRYGLIGVTLDPAFARDGEAASLLAEISGDIALALQNLEAEETLADQLEAERRFQSRLQTLVNVGNRLAMVDSVDGLCRQAVILGREELGFERLGIWLRDDEAPHLQRGTYGVDESGHLRDERSRRISLSDDIIAWSSQQSQMPLKTDPGPLLDDHGHEVGEGTRMRALLWDGDALAGVISVDNLLTGRTMTAYDSDVLTLYASTLSNLIFRKRAEASLREREQYYRTLFETTGAATLVVDDDMRVVLANTEAEELLRYTRTALEGMDIRTFILPADCGEIERQYRARRDKPGSQPRRFELRIRDRQGRIKHTVVSVGLVPNTQQRVMSILDVTKQKALTEQARRQAARQQALNAVVMATTTAGDIDELLEVTLNHTMDALGVQSGGCWILDREVLRDLPPEVSPLRDTIEIPPEAHQQPISIADWTDVSVPWLVPVATIFSNAGIGGTLGISMSESASRRSTSGLLVSDTEPRAWTEEESTFIQSVARQLANAADRLRLIAQIRQQAQRLRRVMDSVPEGVVLLGPDHKVLLANPRGRSDLRFLIGAQVGDQIGRLGSEPLEELLSPPPQGGWHEIRHERRTYETIAEPLTSAHDLTGWVVVLRDVTEERTIRHQLVQQERLAAVGRLAAGIAHDFNNIMAVIVLYAQIASRQLGLSPDLREKLDVIHQQAHRATDLIEQILDFTRQTQLERQPMSLLPYLKEIIKLWRRTLPENIEIELVHGSGTYRIHADPTRIQQALMNLATNARDAMPRGGAIRIDLEELEFADQHEPPLPGMSAGRWVKLDFIDTGEGMESDVLSHAYEPFYTTKETGTGLGLPQVLGIVQQHGGAMDISSKVGGGTTVTIYIPAFGEASIAEAPSVQSGSLVEGGQEQILVVEDNPQTRMALVEALHTMNYRAIQTTTGREALDVLDRRAAEIDVILSDAVMPEMGLAGLLDGLVARKVGIPVIVISGYLQPDERERLRNTGPLVAWLTKPVDLHTLAQTIEMVLEGDARGS